jgi:hypothetical protein
MIEEIYRFEAEHQRWVAMLLEHGCGEEDRFETMSGARADDATESAHRLTVFLGVIWKLVEPLLHGSRSSEALNDPALGRSHPGYCLFRSITQISLCLSPMVK